MTISDNIRNKRLATAVDKLAPKFGLRTFSSSTTAIAQQIDRTPPGQSPNRDGDYTRHSDDDTLFGNILERFVNVVTHVDLTENFSRYINATMPNTPEYKARFGNLMTILADDKFTNSLRDSISNPKLKKVYMSTPEQGGVAMLPDLIGPTEDLRQCCNISIICSKTPQLSLANRNVNACTIFLNGTRSIDMSKAVPYLEVNFEFPLAPTGPADEAARDQRLLAPSLYKLILGGSPVSEGTPISKLVNANLISGSYNPDDNSSFTRVGMEIFTSPQTMVNGNETANESLRLNSVQDKFRPFLSLKEFSATVGTNGFGTMSYSTAKLSMVLHDKSRLAEIAPFIRADIRGKTRVDVEYGWIHPDGEALIRQNPNYFADIINGMRKKEKFQIPTSTFSFNENGEVNIELNLVTLGTMETQYDLIGIGEGPDDLQTLRNTQETIDRLIRETHIDEVASAESNGQPRIHGLQVINAVSDGFQSGFRLTPEERRSFQAFVRSTGGPRGNAQIEELRLKLKELYGSDGRGRAGSTIGSVTNDISRRTLDTLTYILNFIGHSEFNNEGTAGGGSTRGGTNTRDPFLNPRRTNTHTRGRAPETVRVLSNTRPSATSQTALVGKSASLATLLTSFVGVPLAKLGKQKRTWDEVQFVYYTFNDGAGYAHGQNISSFEIDLNYFYERYNKFRLDNISRSGNITLNKFWQFLNQDIIDDIAAPSYELWDEQGALAKQRPRNSENNENASGAVIADEEYEHNRRMTALMKIITHNGEWKPPQLEISLENLKELHDQDGVDQSKTILRVHVYDKTAAASESLNAIIAASRQASMSISGEGNPVDVENGNNGVDGVTDLGNRRLAWRETINRGLTAGIVEEINNTNPARYAIKGGFKAIKKFAMNNSAYLIPGAQGSLIKGVSVSSMQDPNATLQLISNPRPSENIYPNGSGDRGLPLYLMPADVSMDMMGCPLIAFTSNYFVDFNTNTSIDDVWMVSGIDHKIGEGSFSTNVKFRPVSGYGHYTNYLNQLRDMELALQSGGQIMNADNERAQTHDQQNSPPRRRRR